MNKAITTIKSVTAVALMSAMLSGCGLTQKVSEGTVAITKSIFYRQVTVLHLDIRAREGVNNNASGHALSTMVRIYQLKDRQAFDSTDYASLFDSDSEALKADLVAEKDVRLRPGEAIAVDVPMDKRAQFVAVAAMFLSPDEQKNSWRLVLSRDDLDPDTARQIELNQQTITLQPLKDK